MINIYDSLASHAANQPDKLAFRMVDQCKVVSELTFLELFQSVSRLSEGLESIGIEGPVILLFPQSLAFIEVTLACFKCGLVVVPVPLPRGEDYSQLEAIIQSSRSQTVLTSREGVVLFSQLFDRKEYVLDVYCPFELLPEKRVSQSVSKEEIAFLLYTSGSTSEPKGVALTHQQLLYNAKSLVDSLSYTTTSVSASWLPQFHGFGILFNFLFPLYSGSLSIIMLPKSGFINPEHWLDVLDMYKVSHIACSNVGYKRCLSWLGNNPQKKVSLAHLKKALCGGEVINPDVVEQFSLLFGVSEDVFTPVYGMSESNIITVKKDGNTPVAILDRSCLKQHQLLFKSKQDDTTKQVVSCGVAIQETNVLSVNVETKQPCLPNQIGELWVKGPSLATHYWGQKQASRDAFMFYIGCDGPYLRTGDLGFVKDNHVYITGRRKELIIKHGKNYYPADIEAFVLSQVKEIDHGLVAAFSDNELGNERLFVLLEMSSSEKNLQFFEEKGSNILSVIEAGTGISVDEFVCVQKGDIPKTASGKIQRSKCRQQLLAITPLLEVKPVCEEKVAYSSPESLYNHYFEHTLEVSSLKLVAFASELERLFGIRISLQSLLSCDTDTCFKDLIKRLPKIPREGPSSSVKQQKVKGPFSLSALQESYMFHRLSGRKTVAYFEIVVSDIEQVDLEERWNQLVASEAILRVVFDNDANQRVLLEAPYHYPIVMTTKDLETIREDYRSLDFSNQEWPLFDIQTSEQSNHFIIHVAFDLMIVNLTSVDTLFGRWFSNLPLSDVKKGCYQTAIEALIDKEKKGVEQYFDYWKGKLQDKLIPPVFFSEDSSGLVEQTMVRYTHQLSAHHVEKIQSITKEKRITVSAFFLAAFIQTLSSWALVKDFSVVIPFLQQDQDNDVLGLFMIPLFFPVIASLTQDLLDNASRVMEQLFEGLSYGAVSTSSILRHYSDISCDRGLIVFSSLLGQVDQDIFTYDQYQIDLDSSFVKTAGVQLEHQLISIDGKVHLIWDVDVSKIHQDIALTMFHSYCSLIETLDLPSPFYSLNQVQKSYLIGRAASFSGDIKSCQLYVEFKLRSVSSSTIIDTWMLLMSEFEDSRLLLTSDFQVERQESAPSSPVIYDFSSRSLSDIEAHLASVRQEMAYSVKDLSRDELWECRLTKLDNDAVTLHFSFDFFFIDAQSAYFLIATFFTMLGHDGGTLLKPKPHYSKYSHYRHSLLKTLTPKPGPFDMYSLEPQFLSEYTSDEGRYCLSMTCSFYDELKKKVASLSWDMNSVLLFFLCHTIKHYVSDKQFTVVVVKMPRKPFDFNYKEAVGEFTTLSYLSFDGSVSDSIESQITDLDSWLSNELALVPYDRLSEFKAYQKGGKSSFSFVYSMIPEDINIQLPPNGEFVLCKAQTPHVKWDQFCSIINNSLIIHWDIESTYCSKSVAQRIQQDYIKSLEAFACNKTIPALRSVFSDEVFVKEAKLFDYEGDGLALTLLDGVMKTIRSFPEHIAVVCGSCRMTYKALECASNQCAHWLVSLGVCRDTRVGFCLSNSVEILPLLLGILKCGAVFVPLDTGLPDKRKGAIAQDLELHLFIDGVSVPDLDPSIQQVTLQNQITLQSFWSRFDNTFLGEDRHLRDPAYIILTSGSTGESKGVELSHGSVMNTLNDIRKRFQLVETDSILNVSSLGFDLSIFDVFGVLSVGGKVVFPEDSQRLNPGYWADIIDRESITLWNSVPSLMSLLYKHARQEQLSTLRLCLLSGDWVPINLASTLRRDYPSMQLVSLGGATEVSVWSVYYLIDEVSSSWSSIPYGGPLSNQVLCVVNDNGQLCDEGEIGELYIGGKGVAEGYVNHIHLTEDKFISTTLSGYSGRFYKTGDLVSCDTSGLFWIHGRKDNQVKLNGLRIECGDIENHVNQSLENGQSIVILKGEKDAEKSLVCFYTASEAVDQDWLKDALKESLPLYMIPNHFIYLDIFPLTSNQKVDRGHLLKWASYEGVVDLKALNYCGKDTLVESRLQTLLKPLLFSQVDGQYSAQYPSAEACYPMKVYLYIHHELSSDLKKGLYYLEQRQQLLLYCGEVFDFEDRDQCVGDCHLIFASNASYIRSKYGDHASSFMLTELGSMVGLLSAKQSAYSLESLSDVNHQELEGMIQKREIMKQLYCRLVQDDMVNTPVSPGHLSCDLAVIGMSGRFPQSPSIYAFWDFLSKGQSAVSDVPQDRPWFGDKRGIKGAFLSGVDSFDASLFKCSAAEARFMDPQERLFLESVWETLEDAGYTSMALNKVSEEGVGVFVGSSYSDYQRWGKGVGLGSMPLSSGMGHIANRVSHYFHFLGPSFAVDSLCSSSFSALDMAVKAIAAGDCSAAIVGGCNLTLQETKYHVLNRYDMLSSSGQCHSFNSHGDGFVPGEGVGSVLIKSLSQAKKDGDHIYTVIKGVSVSGTGYRRGYTMPNDQDQYRVMTKSIHRAGLLPTDLDYVECHAPGTYLGDTSELKALSYLSKDRKEMLKIGSVKPNVGHLEAASGIISFIKMALQLHFKQFLPTIGVTEPHSLISDLSQNLSVVTDLSPWEKEGKGPIRRGAVMSFGAGGTNGSVVLEEFISNYVATPCDRSQLFVLSAMSWEQLIQYVKRVYCFIDMYKPSLEDVCFTLQRGRQAMKVRLFIVADSLDSLMASLVQIQALKPSVSLDHLGIDVSDSDRSGDPVKMFDSLAQLGQAWISGESVDWSSCFPAGDKRRISLPTYPFSKTSFLPSFNDSDDLCQEKNKSGDLDMVSERDVVRCHWKEWLLRIEIIDVIHLVLGRAIDSSDYSQSLADLSVNQKEMHDLKRYLAYLPIVSFDSHVTVDALMIALEEFYVTKDKRRSVSKNDGLIVGAPYADQVISALYVSFCSILGKGLFIDFPVSFADFGVDSISARKFVMYLNDTFSLDLSETDVYVYDSPKEFARYMIQCLIKRDFIPLHIQEALENADYMEVQLRDCFPEKCVSFSSSVMFEEMGLTSIERLTVIDTINKQFGATFEPVVLYDYATFDSLISYLQSTLKQHIMVEHKV